MLDRILIVVRRSDFAAELKDFPSIEAEDTSNYLVTRTSFFSRKPMEHRTVWNNTSLVFTRMTGFSLIVINLTTNI